MILKEASPSPSNSPSKSSNFGLNTRLLEEKGVGVEIPRNEQDGSFTSDSVAESVKFAVVSEESESLRANARRVSGLFGDRNRNGRLIDDCVDYLMENRIGKSSS
ncbi:hypothetical protein RND71_033739 [Anisodus tanguticus]|uniref:Uncharacterized protein n=1 Tax=Anisodus tanguticus TaxID=243964 RepID=A0AAE1R951_9SOLA|nr:hypothetical protein RND71_033739 [Anisodus tanguticus]